MAASGEATVCQRPEETMPGVPLAPTSGVTMTLMATILQLASKEHGLHAPTVDTPWKGTLKGKIDIKVYAPLGSLRLRDTCGVSWEMLSESFRELDPHCRTNSPTNSPVALNAVHVGQRRLGNVKRRGIFTHEQDQMLLAPSGPYMAKKISAQECKYLARVAPRYSEHFEDCLNSLLPRFYCILRIGKGGLVKSTAHWIITDNLNDLPLPVRLTYELKGDCSRKTLVNCDNVVLKEGNLPLVDNQRRLPQVSPCHMTGMYPPHMPCMHHPPQVSPWGVRLLLMALSVDCGVLEELKSSNFSLLVFVSPARGEVVEMNYLDLAPRRPPYIRLDGMSVLLGLFCSLMGLFLGLF